MRECDYLIIGAGIAGASAAYHIGSGSSIIILEREDQPGYHSTGRSAAVFTENYGPRTMRVMSKVSAPFLRNPHEGFSDIPLLHGMGVIFVARDDQRASMAALLKDLQELSDTLVEVTPERAYELNRVLRPGYVAAAAHDPTTANMDVNAIHMGYLRKARADGTEVVTNAEVTALEHKGGKWHVTTPAGAFAAPVVMNAAGAWADVVADLAGVRQIGLVPKRRTAITFDPPAGEDVSTWVAVGDCEEQWYFKPESGQVLGSPADETPVPPQDIQPDEVDIALVRRPHPARHHHGDQAHQPLLGGPAQLRGGQMPGGGLRARRGRLLLARGARRLRHPDLLGHGPDGARARRRPVRARKDPGLRRDGSRPGPRAALELERFQFDWKSLQAARRPAGRPARPRRRGPLGPLPRAN